MCRENILFIYIYIIFHKIFFMQEGSPVTASHDVTANDSPSDHIDNSRPPSHTCSLRETKKTCEPVSWIIFHYCAVISWKITIRRFSNISHRTTHTHIYIYIYICKRFICTERCRWLCCCLLFADRRKCGVHRPAAAALHTFVLRKNVLFRGRKETSRNSLC